MAKNHQLAKRDAKFEEMTPLEKYQQCETRKSPLSEPGFFNQWLFYFIDKVVNNSQHQTFDFDLLYKQEEQLTYDSNFPKFQEFLKTQNPG